jgi:hypothetical protein
MTRSDGETDSVINPDRPIPRADTGSSLRNGIASAVMKLVQIERRFDPAVRPAFDATVRDPLARLVTALINSRRPNENLSLAEERIQPAEELHVQSVIDAFQQQMSSLWKPGKFERGGNTKTHAVVRGELEIHDRLAPELSRGVFAEARSYPAWVRFSGPGPYITPDIDDVGFMSISVKLMRVPGPKLMQEEKFTQDFLGVCTPTFVTPDIAANVSLQRQSLKNATIFHFLNFGHPHVLDLVMQGLWTKTQSSPLEASYFSCVPYLLGEGQAMQYSFWPTKSRRTPIPRLPFRPPDNYLRNALVAALAAEEVSFEMKVQMQTDSFTMPIENAGVLWPEKVSPRVAVATLRLPRQTLNYAGELELARRLSYNPWHCVPEHRPLGNQSRARRRMYATLSALRHTINDTPHFEPDSTEDLCQMA